MPALTWYRLQVLGQEDSATTSGDALLSALERGDSDVLRDTYRRHHEAVRAFARRLLGSDADAEEIVQDVFVGLPEAIRSFRGDCSLATFVMSVTVNRARRFMRSAGRLRSAHARLAEQQSSEEHTAPGADEASEREELAQALLRAMARLPDEQRLAFVLCDVEERSSAEAAQIMGIPASTLRSRLGVARSALRQLLEPEARP